MAPDISQAEFERVVRLAAPQRHAYAMARFAEGHEVWGLWQGGWALVPREPHAAAVPLWPHWRFAAACRSGEWAAAELRVVSVSTWLDCWAPDLIRAGRSVCVLPLPGCQGTFLSPQQFQEEIENESDGFD